MPELAQFELAGRKHNYFDGKPSTKTNERRVEVSLGVDFLNRSPSNRVMEVGNVMRSNISQLDHFVIDLNEKHNNWKNYLNADCLTWTPNRPLDSVLSISTVEHTFDIEKAISRILSWAPRVLLT